MSKRDNYSRYALDVANLLNVAVGERRAFPLMCTVQGEMTFRADYIEFKEGIKPRTITQVIVDKSRKGYLGVFFVYRPLPDSEHGTEPLTEEWDSWTADTLDKVWDILNGIL